ncbi:MAG: transporter substrate-binding domain-containing protein [Pseudodesulfovibrio sp.]|uniref:hypothetical protein n=1 Tax=Pseudodesulfovibrio sp. TaxID=2035812 RepID=UPI003D12A8AD
MIIRTILVCLVVLALGSPARAMERLTLGCGDDTMSLASLEVLKAAYARLDVDVDAERLPAARSMEQADSGVVDGEIIRIKAIEGECPNLVRVDVPINHVVGIILTCGRTIDPVTLDKARELRLGVRIGNRYAEKLTGDFPRVLRLPDIDQLLKLLLARRLDAVLVDRYWAETRLGEPGMECLRINEPPVAVLPLYHYLHRRHADLVPAITAELEDMRADGEIQRILAAYGTR